MAQVYEEDELPLPLLHRSVPKTAAERGDSTLVRRDYREARTRDRLSPATAGIGMGLLAGAAGLGVVHAMHLMPIAQGIARLGVRLEVPPDAALPLAYVAAAVGGAIVGAAFASVTRHLRRFVPLVIWALVFFVSLTMLALAASASYGRGLGVSMAPAILLASAAYALVVSLQLPLRKRS